MKKKFKVTASTGEITSAFRDNNISEDDVRELVLTITNDGDMYRGIIQSVINNLTRKYKKGNYDRDLAVKAWQYVADEGVRRYDKQFGSGRGSVAWLNPATRRAIAEELRDYYEDIIFYEEDDVNASTTARNKKIITAAQTYMGVDEFKGWSGGDETYEAIVDLGKLDALEAYIDEMYYNEDLGEGLISEVELNDWLRYEPENVAEALGLYYNEDTDELSDEPFDDNDEE